MLKSHNLQEKNKAREQWVDEPFLRRCCVLCGGPVKRTRAVLTIQESRVSLLQPVLLY